MKTELKEILNIDRLCNTLTCPLRAICVKHKENVNKSNKLCLDLKKDCITGPDMFSYFVPMKDS